MMRTSSDAIFHTDRFRHDVRAYMIRNTTSLSDVARVSDIQYSTLQRFLANDVGASLHIACKLAIFADLSLDGYIKTWGEQEEYRAEMKREQKALVRVRRRQGVIDWRDHNTVGEVAS